MTKMLMFRLDDICPGLKRDNLRRLEEIFDKYNIKPMLGVVPDNKDSNLIVDEVLEEEFWDSVRRLQDKGWYIAQHGYTHVYCNEESGILEANPFSEFAGVEYSIQQDIIMKGKDILIARGIVPTFFMAPGHTFDENTLKALKANGIFKITDGYARQTYIRDDILFVPCTLSEAKEPAGIDTVCIHLNNWTDTDFEQLELFLRRNSMICTSFDEVINNIEPLQYGSEVIKQEKAYKKLKMRKQKAAESERMQRYLRRSYSENKNIKLIKRIIFLPMLLRK